MIELSLKTYLIVCPLVFFGGFVDAIAGGGGLITLPAFMMAGIPVHFAQGTNKLSSSMGLVMAAIQYGRKGLIRYKPALVAAAGSTIGGSLGARALLFIPAEKAQLMLMIGLPVIATILLTRKSMKREQDDIVDPKTEYTRGFFIGLGCGFYAGFFGAGGGSFLIMFSVALLGYSMITASATAKVINLACDTSALVTYALSGRVIFALGIPCMLCCSLGSFVGSRMAIKLGSKFVRPVMIAVMSLIFVKLIYDFTLRI
ncbi:MAG: TSUP family transporter [Oscillospiraceae bacterium]|nr:TSUP family transporter [Oscillospiraceae bacterium]